MIGGKVLDPGAIAAACAGHIGVTTWFAVASRIGIVLYLPGPAVAEVATLRPHTGPRLARLLDHPQVVRGDTDEIVTAEADRLMTAAGVWDATAAIVVQVAHHRGWPALAADPGRLLRIDPGLDIQPVA